MKKILIFIALILAITAFSGCSGDDKITIFGENYTEAKIFAYMHKELIEDGTDLKVEVKTDLPATSVTIEAMDKGEGDLASMYTGEITNGYFEYDDSSREVDHIVKEAQKGFDEHYNFKWFDPLGFENQYVFAVRKEYAEKHNLKTLSDLENVAEEATVRVEAPWMEREDDGYKSFQDLYGFKFGDVKPMEVTLIYKAIDNEEADVGLVYSTDARLSLYDLVVLEDNKKLFPPYYLSSVIRKETLKEHPEIEEILERMVGQFDEETVRELNGGVDLDDRNPEDVVKEFLEENNMLK